MSERLLSFALLGLALTACQAQKPNVSAIDRQAPADTSKSFRIDRRIEINPPEAAPVEKPDAQAKTAPGAAQTKSLIRLQKDALGKVFLLLPSVKTASATPQWEDFAPVAVVFEKSGTALGLFELPTSVYDAIKPESLLGTFKILEETDKDIAFEWTLGLNSLPTRSAYVQPMQEGARKELEKQGLSDGITVKDSFVRKAALENNELRIEQISRVQSPLLMSSGRKIRGKQEKELKILTLESTYVVNFHIRPYIENKRYQKREQDPLRRLDFFAVPVLEKGTSTPKELAVHWDISPEAGPINVLISPETPADYRETVKEGATYWNRVFGREVLKVQDGSTDGPVDRAIVIRWIPWDDAGFAYASMQSDPFTGEVLRAQVFMTSSFISDEVTSKPDVFTGAHKNTVNLKSTHLCELHHDNVVSRDLPAKGAFSEAQKHDMVRLVIAHEVGHTMGLRHNFAGSLGSPLSTEDVFKQTSAYKKDLNHPGVPVSSTVMDYLQDVQFSASGRWVKSNVLPYDKMAMDYAQTGKLDEKIAPFCSDDEIMLAQFGDLSAYDCSQRDWGRNPIQAAVLGLPSLFRLKMIQTLDVIYAAMFPKDLRTTDPLSFDLAATTLQFSSFPAWSWDLQTVQSVLFTKFKDTTEKDRLVSYVTLKKKTPGFDPFNSTVDITSDSVAKEKIKADLAAAGGLAAILKNAAHLKDDLTFDLDSVRKDIDDVLSTYPFKKGKTMIGTSYEITDAQVERLKSALTEAATKNFIAHVASTLTQLLPGETTDYDMATESAQQMTAKLRLGLLSDEDNAKVAELATRLILMTDKTVTLEGWPNKPSVGVPLLPLSARTALLAVFDEGLWRSDKNLGARMKLRAEILKRIRVASLAAPNSKTDPNSDKIEDLRARAAQAILAYPLPPDLGDYWNAELTLLEKMK